jgi:hypothetical protein
MNDRQRLVEVRSYRLLPGARDAFDEAFTTRALPMLHDAGIEVVAFGPSLHDTDAWFLTRAFDDLADLTRREDAFYASDAWRCGPREAIVGAIVHYTDTLLWLGDAAIDDLRRRNRPCEAPAQVTSPPPARSAARVLPRRRPRAS